MQIMNHSLSEKKKKAKAHSFEDLMNDYHTLVEKQEKSGSKVRNSPSDHDLDVSNLY